MKYRTWRSLSLQETNWPVCPLALACRKHDWRKCGTITLHQLIFVLWEAFNELRLAWQQPLLISPFLILKILLRTEQRKDVGEINDIVRANPRYWLGWSQVYEDIRRCSSVLLLVHGKHSNLHFFKKTFSFCYFFFHPKATDCRPSGPWSAKILLFYSPSLDLPGKSRTMKQTHLWRLQRMLLDF